MNAFTILGVAPTATKDEIKAAYRKQAHVLHPDKHIGADGTIPAAAHNAFCTLTRAFETAMRSAPEPRTAYEAPRKYVPLQRPDDRIEPPSTVRRNDPLLTLLTLPRVLDWTAEELSFWALTVIPSARKHLAHASRIAESAGPISGKDTTLATAHVLLTLTLRLLGDRRHVLDADRIAAAYDALEARMPRTVIAGLPGRARALVDAR